MSITVRAASRDEAALLAHLHGSSFAEKWSAGAFDDLLSMPGTFALLAGVGGNDWQSFALARVAAGEAEILSLATVLPARRKGLAHALVVATAAEAARRGAGEIFLEVSKGNAAARALYLGLGFAEVGQRPRYYSNLDGAHADALTLVTALPLAV